MQKNKLWFMIIRCFIYLHSEKKSISEYIYIVACQRGGVSNKPILGSGQQQDTGSGILWYNHTFDPLFTKTVWAWHVAILHAQWAVIFLHSVIYTSWDPLPLGSSIQIKKLSHYKYGPVSQFLFSSLHRKTDISTCGIAESQSGLQCCTSR